MPTTCSVDLKGKIITFWYKDIQEAVTHCLNLDSKAYTYDYFTCFDSLDVVVGGEHGQRKFRNKSNSEILAVMHTIKVGHMDCAKDT
jgi:hypothetical protein